LPRLGGVKNAGDCLPTTGDLPKGDKSSTMFYVYFLKNKSGDRIYIGSTEDLNSRLDKHNKGYVKSTKAYRPWTLEGHETYNTRSEAVKREYFLKTSQQRVFLRKKYIDKK